MRHRIAGKQLSRTTPHRKALRRNLAASLIQHGAVRTTVAKAREVRPFIERLITIARVGNLQARRRVISMLQDRDMHTYDSTTGKHQPEEKTVVGKLFDEIAPRYADRPGGYTRIIHLPERRIGDAGKQVLLQLVEQSGDEHDEKTAGRKKRKKKKK